MAPLLEIRHLPLSRPVPQDVTLLFTSANGVAAWTDAAGKPHAALCAGAATLRAAETAGHAAKQAGDTAAELADIVIAAPPDGPLWHVAGVHRAADLAGRLAEAGLPSTTVALYDQVTLPLPEPVGAALAAGEIGTVLLMSPRTARAFATATQALDLPPSLRLLCLSQAVAAPVRDLGVRVEVAELPRQEALLDLL